MSQLIYKEFGQVDYLHTMQTMQQFTDQRTEQTTDECWFLRA